MSDHTVEQCKGCGEHTLLVPSAVRVTGSPMLRHVGREPEACTCPPREHFVAGCCHGCRVALNMGRAKLTGETVNWP